MISCHLHETQPPRFHIGVKSLASVLKIHWTRYRVRVQYFELVIPIGCVQVWWTEHHISWYHVIPIRQKGTNNNQGLFCECSLFKKNVHSPKVQKKQLKNSQISSSEVATGSLSGIRIAKRFIEDFIEHMTSCWPTKLFPGDWRNLV